MIIIHVMGGLGNQLYHYALYEKFKFLGKDVKLDLYAYKEAAGAEQEWRSLELEWLDLPQYEVCTADERELFMDSSMKLADRIRRKLTGRRDKTVREKADYMPEIFAMDDVYLYGFWGCELYYKDIIPILQEKIRFPESSNPRNREFIDAIRHENAVSIHIRRKDYLTVADGKRYMGICTDVYYTNAINYISERIENPVFYIFSDDTAYAKEHYDKENMHVVDWNTGRESLHDMELMSHCRHNICANSTFSIWGARLNKNPDKIMIRPLHNDNYETSDVETVCKNWPGWILIDAMGSIY
ncbi:MAG: alpha-1,2-fucosyltransferase [Lachnospiraceae bacterium]|nr:alpha-1,2-fucosyltransferase [Lachnospiraceae bacterium]